MNLIGVVLGQLEGYVVTDWGNGASIATMQVDVRWWTLGISSFYYFDVFPVHPQPHTLTIPKRH
jgi:hypothetical protein